MAQWYYAVNGQQEGPVEEAALRQLLAQGKLTSDDLIWKEGMAEWQRYGDLFTEGGAGAASSLSENTSTAQSGTPGLGGFGAPAPGSKASELGLKYDFGDFLCWGVAVTLIPCLGLFGYIALLVLFTLEFLELKKAVEAGKVQESQYAKMHPALLLIGLFCCSLVIYPLFMHWRNQTGVFKPQPHAVWFAIVIMVVSVGFSLLLNGAGTMASMMNQIQGQ